MYAEEELKAGIVSEALEKSGEIVSTQRDSSASGIKMRYIDSIGVCRAPDFNASRVQRSELYTKERPLRMPLFGQTSEIDS